MKSNGNNAPTATPTRARDARDRAAHAHETYRDDYRDGWLDCINGATEYDDDGSAYADGFADAWRDAVDVSHAYGWAIARAMEHLRNAN